MEKKNIIGRIWKNTYFRFVLFGLLIATVPALVEAGILKTSMLGILGGALIYAIAAQGLNILLGYSGLISLGTAGFMGLGAYISAYVTEDLGMPFEMGMLMAIVIPAIFGVLIGLASLRISGLYLGIITLCVSEILRKTFDELVEITGGFAGKMADNPTLFGVIELDQGGTYILIVIILVLIMMLTYNLVNGQMGRALHAMRGSQVAAQAMGVSLMKYRLVAFVLATVFASIAGAMYVHFINFVYPSTWILPVSLNILAMIVIGGLRSIYGTVIGAIIIYSLPDLLLKRIPVVGEISGFAYVVSGVLIILVIMFYPGGVVKVFSDMKNLVMRAFDKKEKKGE